MATSVYLLLKTAKLLRSPNK